ncbi:5-methylcytosine-specific restriction protein A [Nocardiopsis terrae]|uniref:5-methylcytosine-specific restriction protein A n=1 Tax=Nocardiopsis terrae TaxID=372655 RepID=A0ABR9HF48_9ACTN|nr:HNH endonuclease [Nocardiopsis terrae]MBE1457655.1 5-methylcytosine-specific restriction protein A [Nocardiopsis terrae]
MGLSDITRTAVLQAIQECDTLGRTDFLQRYGFKEARSYLLEYEGRTYDSKAVVGVAHKFVSGRALESSEFSGGEQHVGRLLRDLDFQVRFLRDPPWEQDEIILACALVVDNGWKELRSGDAGVTELSALLRRLPLHPVSARSDAFRSPHSVSRKTTDLATSRPGYTGAATKGGKLDKEVVRAFWEEPERMTAAAARIRALSGEFEEQLPVDDSVEGEEFSAVEGRLLLRAHRSRERDPKLRRARIDQVRKKGLPVACEVCEFDFGRFYGERGQGYIECHHVVPLHHIGESRTRPEDLALLCSNCHRMIHRSKDWITPEELRAVVGRQQR